MSSGLAFVLFLCCVYFLCFYHGRSSFCLLPSLVLLHVLCCGVPRPRQAVSLPLCWLLLEVGALLAAVQAAWGRENNKGKQRIPLQKAVEESRWPVSVGWEDKEPGTMGAWWSTNTHPSH